MRGKRQIAVGAVTVGLVTAGLTGTAAASDSRSGYRECAARTVVFGTTNALNGAYYAQHYLTNAGVRYSSTRWTNPGYHSWTFGLRGGGWQVYTSNGTVASAGATCSS